jgi:hypothetical protein
MKIKIVNKQIDAIVIAEMKQVIKGAKVTLSYTNLHPEDREEANKVCKAAQVILRHYGG